MGTVEADRYPYAGPESLRSRIDAALRGVVDPELALSIVDVGLVCGVTVGPGRVDVVLTTTSAACPAAATLADDVADALADVVPDGTAVAVDLSWSPPWTPARLGERARDALGWPDDDDPRGAPR